MITPDSYPHQSILLLWDRAPWHQGAGIRALLKATARLERVFFPPVCPQLNPQEHVWAQVRAEVSHNHTFKDFSRLKAAFEQVLSSTLFQFDCLETYAPIICSLKQKSIRSWVYKLHDMSRICWVSLMKQLASVPSINKQLYRPAK